MQRCTFSGFASIISKTSSSVNNFDSIADKASSKTTKLYSWDCKYLIASAFATCAALMCSSSGLRSPSIPTKPLPINFTSTPSLPSDSLSPDGQSPLTNCKYKTLKPVPAALVANPAAAEVLRLQLGWQLELRERASRFCIYNLSKEIGHREKENHLVNLA